MWRRVRREDLETPGGRTVPDPAATGHGTRPGAHTQGRQSPVPEAQPQRNGGPHRGVAKAGA